jgi:1-acyl-sn-glycerol-3-phosphate acyltransferase
VTDPWFQRLSEAPSFHDEGYGFDVFGLHPPVVASVVEATAPLYDHYFRVDSRGIDNIPQDGAAILVANHGGALPVDAAMLCLDVLRGTSPTRIPRPVADHFVPRLPLVSTLFARCGVVSGTRTNVRTLVERGELIAIFPEGVSGTAKRFRDRYRIQDWHVGFAELAIRFRAPVIPVGIVGAEESWPVALRIRTVRLFGAPYLPVPASPVPLPARYHIRYGAPLRLDREGHDDDADDAARVGNAAARVREEVEALIRVARSERAGVFR